jgi:proteic killer suppression protein
MIRAFADRATELLFKDGSCPARWRSFAKVAKRKLDMLNAAVKLSDLRSPPGNRLEVLKGARNTSSRSA